MQLAKEVKFRFYKNTGIRRGRLIRLQLWNLGDAQNAELGGQTGVHAMNFLIFHWCGSIMIQNNMNCIFGLFHAI